MHKDQDTIYAINHYNFFDKIVLKKRLEISNIINNIIKDFQIYDALDIGTTSDDKNVSSNTVIKNIKNIEKFKCISDQMVTSNFFSKILKSPLQKNFQKTNYINFLQTLLYQMPLLSMLVEY